MAYVYNISKHFTKLLSDESLTNRAVLNALSTSLDYMAQLAVSFLITPLMVSGLGNYYFGAWQTLNRIVGYLSPAIGKPTQALRWTLVNQQASVDYDLKRRHVGSAVIVWLCFFPILMFGGALLAWFTPYWLKATDSAFWHIRLTTLLLVINLLVVNFSALPKSILEGENLGYKRIGLSATLTIFSGLMAWLVLYFQKGIVGIAIVALLISILSGYLYLKVVRTNVSWFGVKRPTFREGRSFLDLSTWFIAWDVITKLMIMSDTIVLALLSSVESVTPYSLTKNAPETTISFIGIIVFSIVPGLGGIIGSGQLKKAANLRNEIMSITWLISVVLGTVILVWNRVFIALWVGQNQYAGQLANLLMVLVAFQFVFIKNDASIIDLSLRIQSKVFIGALSVLLSIGVSIILVSHYKLGIVGLCLGLITGRLVLSLCYPVLAGRILNIPFFPQIRNSFRPAIVTIFLFGLAYLLGSFHLVNYFSGIMGWLLLIISGGLTAVVLTFISFYLGLSSDQRRNILNRIKHLISKRKIV